MTFTDITELILLLMPIVFVIILLCTMFTFAAIEKAVHAQLLRTKTKRAIKEARRSATNEIFREHAHFQILHSLHGFFHMTWMRKLAGDDPYVRHLCTVNDWMLRLWLPTMALAIYADVQSGMMNGIELLGENKVTLSAAVSGWAAALYALCLVILWFRMMLIRLRDPIREPDFPHPEHQGISVPAYFLRYGYLLGAVAALAVEQPIIAGGLLLADGLHTWLARAARADHFYCMWQDVCHRPMTPHHHSEAFCRRAEKEAKVSIILDLCLGAALVVIPLLIPLFSL